MMGAVYHDPCTVESMQAGAGQGFGNMVFISVLISMIFSSGQILSDGAAQGYIDKLHTLADA